MGKFLLFLACILVCHFATWRTTISAQEPKWAQEFYRNSIDECSKLASDKILKAEQVCALLIVDTWTVNAENLGIASDGKLMASLFASAQRAVGKDLHIEWRLLKDSEVSEKEILREILAFNTGPRTTLVVYYSGHGAWDKKQTDLTHNDYRFDRDTGHLLVTHCGIVDRWKIKEAMERTKAQCKILITDCCASFISRQEGERSMNDPSHHERTQAATPIGADDSLRMSVESFEKLFSEHFGWISYNSALIGKTAPGKLTGSDFTSSLVHHIRIGRGALDPDSDRASAVTWLRIKPATSWRVIKRELPPDEIVSEESDVYAHGFTISELRKRVVNP